MFVQSALLYSTSDGQRRIRCHNLAVPMTNVLNDSFEYIDTTALTHHLARKALNRWDKLGNLEASKQVVEATLNSMTRANKRYAQVVKG